MFRTLSLLEAGATPPYIHNGTLATLEKVVNFYNAGGGSVELDPLGPNDTEVSDLVAFLESLASQILPQEPPDLPTYQLRELGSN